MSSTIDTLKQQLQQLRALHDSGALSAEHYQTSCDKLERALVDAVMAQDSAQSAVQPSASSATTATATAATAAQLTPATTKAPASAAPTIPRRPAWIVPLCAASVVLMAVLGYAWKGAPTLANVRATPNVADAASAPADGQAAVNPMDPSQFAGLVEKLRKRLENEPDNAEGWAMLARSYSMLGKNDDALATYVKASALAPNDAALLADYADALAVKNNRQLAGEPAKLVERALKLDPAQPKALSLAGTIAFDRKDYAGAVALWEKILVVAPDHSFAPQIRDSIAEARQLGGMPPAPTFASPSLPGAAPAASGKPAQVSGTASLAPELAAKANPEDTVFIFARAAEGPRMPLAIVRSQVKNLPMAFTLDDSTAMSPQMKLSAFTQVVVGVRVSKSGQATPQAGDLQGNSAPVAVGSSDVRVVVKDVVAP